MYSVYPASCVGQGVYRTRGRQAETFEKKAVFENATHRPSKDSGRMPCAAPVGAL